MYYWIRMRDCDGQLIAYHRKKIKKTENLKSIQHYLLTHFGSRYKNIRPNIHGGMPETAPLMDYGFKSRSCIDFFCEI